MRKIFLFSQGLRAVLMAGMLTVGGLYAAEAPSADRLGDDAGSPNQEPFSAPTEPKKPTAPKPIMPPSKVQPLPPSEPVPALDASAAKSAFAAVAAKRKGEKAGEGSAEFERLLQQWNPRGKTIQGVKTIIGKPDWEKANAFGYRFDSGWGGWEWSLTNDGKTVIDVKRTGLN